MTETKGKTGKSSLVDHLLEELKSNRRMASVYLVNGFQLKGEIVEFDREAILVKVRESHQLVMRSAVASMYPTHVAKDGNKDGAEEWWATLSNGTGEAVKPA